MELILTLIVAVAFASWQPNPLASALGAGRHQEALELADGLLKQNPRDARLWTARGLAKRGLGDVKQALASFDRALEFQNAFVPALRAAAETAYQNKLASAAAYLDRLLAVEPADTTAHAMAGALAYESNNCARAITHFERAPAAVSGNELAATQFAHCLMDRERPAEAIPVLQRALAINPAGAGTRYNLAVAQLAAGKPTDAAATLAEAKPDSGTLNLLARAQYQAGSIEPALDSLRRAIELAPIDERNYVDLALIGFERNAFQPALELLDGAIGRLPESPRLYLVRGILQSQLGSFEKASADFERAERLAPEQAYGSVGLSVLLSESRQLREAAAILRTRLAAAPSDYLLNYLLADSLIRDGLEPSQPEFAEARQALERSIASRPLFAKAHAALGKLMLKSGERDQAIVSLKTALTHDPENKQALNQLLLALRAAGRSQEAAEVAARLRRLVIR